MSQVIENNIKIEPLLVISGEQGSAKTLLCKMLKALIDPNVAPVRTLAR